MDATLKDAALALARQGYAVFPCRPNSKQPFHKGSFHDATTDEFQIEEWWSECPEANVAIYPDGSTPRLVILDVDVREHGEDGRETLREMESHFPATKSVWTPSGGMHLYYELPEGIEIQSSTRRLGPGLDVRSKGGYVLVPPSVIDGKRYRTRFDRPIVPATNRFMEMAGTPEERHPDADKWLCEEDIPNNIARAKAWLEKEVELDRVAVAGSGGNNFTYATAEVLRDFGLSTLAAEDLLLEVWNPHCQPPWSVGEIGCIVGNAYEYANRPAGTRGAPDPAAMAHMAKAASTPGLRGSVRWADRRAGPAPDCRGSAATTPASAVAPSSGRNEAAIAGLR